MTSGSLLMYKKIETFIVKIEVYFERLLFLLEEVKKQEEHERIVRLGYERKRKKENYKVFKKRINRLKKEEII